MISSLNKVACYCCFGDDEFSIGKCKVDWAVYMKCLDFIAQLIRRLRTIKSPLNKKINLCDMIILTLSALTYGSGVMATIAFDTQDAVIKLGAVGVPQEHADAFVRAIVEFQDNLVNKAILEIALSPIKTDLAILKADSVTLTWMMGVLIAGEMSIVIKTFFKTSGTKKL
jgi:hypothetical protein